jgi:hypothetical protein
MLPKLKAMDAIYVHQKMDYAEAVTGCDRENKYIVYAADSDGNKIGDVPLFKCRE